MGVLRNRRIRAGLALLLLAIAPVCLAADDRDAPPPADAPADAAPEIRDPFFAFMIGLVEGDSLGVWTQDDIRPFIERSGRESKLPIEMIERVERRALGPGDVEISMGRSARRLVRVELTDDLEMSLPYSILGYHPGTMYVSRVLQAVEWNLRSPNLTLPAKDDRPELSFSARNIRALRLDVGHVVLDVDYLVDKILGRYLDDTWTEAFLISRIDEAPEPEDLGLHGMALGRSRKGRPVSGAFDFSQDKVLPNGRPVAKVLSAYARTWVAPWKEPEGSRAWSWKP